MYILKNAARSITRSVARWILIAIMILVIAVSTCVSLSVRQAAITSKEELMSNLNVTAAIGFDRSSFMKGMGADKSQGGSFDKDSFKEKMSAMTSPDLDELQKYAENENVKSFYYSLSTSVDGSDDFSAVDMTGADSGSSESTTVANESSGKSGANGAPDMPSDMPTDGGSKQGGRFGTQGDFTMIGYSSDEAMTDFVSGKSKITDGAVFDEGSAENVCIIPDELAQYNSLAVGDTITVTNPNNEDETLTLKICGIYSSDNTSGEEISGFSISQDSANRILMSYNALKSIIDASQKAAGDDSSAALTSQLNSTYTFADVDSYTAFSEEVYDMGLSEEYTVTSTDYNNYQQQITPIENLQRFALYFLIIVLIIGAIILCVLNIFSVRERKYEIGVMAAIGMKKSKIALQFISEMLIVTLIAVIVGTGVGAAISVPVGDALLSAQNESASSMQTQMKNNFGRDMAQGSNNAAPDNGGLQQPDNAQNGNGIKAPGAIGSYVSEINASVNLTVFLQLMGIAILLCLFASGAAVISVLHYDPLKILSNRD